MTLADFFSTLTDMELVALISEARMINDEKTLNIALIELGYREKNNSEEKNNV